MKKCAKCNSEKPLSNFSNDKKSKDGKMSNCKECMKSHFKKYYTKNKKEHIQRQKDKYNNDPVYKEKQNEASRQHYYDNREWYRKKSDEWGKNNPDRIRELSRERYRRLSRTDGQYRLESSTRNKILQALNNYLTNQIDSIIPELGCRMSYYCQFLQSQFYPEMSWDNRNTVWEIDHIVPTSYGGSFHYTNTRPWFITTQIAESLGYDDIVGNRNHSKIHMGKGGECS